MVYKFRSLREPELSLRIRDTDGDLHTVQFQKIHFPGNVAIGIFETEETKIAEAMIKDNRNGILYMDSDYVKRGSGNVVVEGKPKKPPVEEPPEEPSEEPEPIEQPEPEKHKKHRRGHRRK